MGKFSGSKSTEIWIFGDGASRGNPGPSGWGSIITDGQRVLELGGGEPRATNNRMEAAALLHALESLEDVSSQTPLRFYWDSQFVLSGASSWRFGWAKRGWKTSQGEDVKNKDMWLAIDKELRRFSSKQCHWYHVEGHAGIAANERVDAIASSMAEQKSIDLYEGKFLEYGVDVMANLPQEEFSSSRTSFSSPKPKAKAYYLSLVGGQVHRDSSWSQCEARVKGTSGAKFKKVHNESEEKQTLQKWGVKDPFV